MRMLKGFGYVRPIYYLMLGDIFPCDVCLTCLKKRIKLGDKYRLSDKEQLELDQFPISQGGHL